MADPDNDASMRQRTKSAIVRMVASDRVGRVVQRVSRGQVRSRRARFDVAGWEPHLAAAVAFRLYERSEVRFAVKYLADSEHVLELGGSRGVVSSTLLRKLPVTAQLVSIEANPGLIHDLQDNLNRNCGGRVAEGRHLAISNGAMALFDSSMGALGSSLSTTRGERVPMTSFTELVEALNWPEFSLISDVEGAEASFVLSDEEALRRCSRMVIELHDSCVDGRPTSIADMTAALTGRHGFTKVAQHKDVAVFVRSAV